MPGQAGAAHADAPVTVGVFGHYGNENLGDEAIIEAVMQRVRAQWPDARIYGFSINPRDTEQRYGVPAFPIRYVDVPQAVVAGAKTSGAGRSNAGSRLERVKSIVKRAAPVRILYYALVGLLRLPRILRQESRFLGQSYGHLRAVDLLLVSGSNQFLDNFGGVWGFPYTLLKWSILAKLTGTKLAFLSVGAGPLSAPLSRLFVRVALRLADYASFRDVASKRLVETYGFRELGGVYPDLAHGIAMPSGSNKAIGEGAAARGITVGINPMPVYDHRYWHDPDKDRYRDYVGRLAEFASLLVHGGYRVFFFPTQTRDENVIQDILRTVAPGVRAVIEADGAVGASASVTDLLKLYVATDIVVATRFHGVLLALRTGRPVLGICYFRKTRDLLRDMGQEDYAVDLETFTAADLAARFNALAADRVAMRAQISRRSDEYRVELEAQYRAVFALVASPQSVPSKS